MVRVSRLVRIELVRVGRLFRNELVRVRLARVSWSGLLRVGRSGLIGVG